MNRYAYGHARALSCVYEARCKKCYCTSACSHSDSSLRGPGWHLALPLFANCRASFISCEIVERLLLE
jgi:hypothetical protein